MSLAEETEMTATEIDDFLSRHETGVLALASDNTPYAIPISYGYDADSRSFYMRLVSTPESEKREFLDSAPEVRLVVYDERDGGRTYHSAVAVGTLETIDPTDLTVEDVEQYGTAKRPLFEIWGESKANLDIQLYRFEPDHLSGRRTEIDRGDA
ncbi:pyridoxamine 5'-phosphate oxidase family protein [Saliphagus sp. GCM10025334]